MIAIETTGTIDSTGQLHLSEPLEVAATDVRVMVLLPADNELTDRNWLTAQSQNPAFDFLHDEAEAIYLSTDDIPFQA